MKSGAWGRWLPAIGLLLLLAAQPASAVYSCPMEDGKTILSDVPCDAIINRHRKMESSAAPSSAQQQQAQTFQRPTVTSGTPPSAPASAPVAAPAAEPVAAPAVAEAPAAAAKPKTKAEEDAELLRFAQMETLKSLGIAMLFGIVAKKGFKRSFVAWFFLGILARSMFVAADGLFY